MTKINKPQSRKFDKVLSKEGKTTISKTIVERITACQKKTLKLSGQILQIVKNIDESIEIIAREFKRLSEKDS